MRITSKGQVTIPASIREQAGLLPGAEISFAFDGEVVTITRAEAKPGKSRGERIAARLRRMAAQIPPAAETASMTTDEIMTLTRGE